MGEPSCLPAKAQPLRAHSQIEFRNGPYLYRLTSEGDRSLYSVSDSRQTLAEPILYAFGSGAGAAL